MPDLDIHALARTRQKTGRRIEHIHHRTILEQPHRPIRLHRWQRSRVFVNNNSRDAAYEIAVSGDAPAQWQHPRRPRPGALAAILPPATPVTFAPDAGTSAKPADC
ncbi:hypothetical protein GCM10009733_007220 [Nonomuraea maheshkhaliensis]|uniref:Uncharacterized protein n=1 Tax=Nonomuraea maheshkhaliensis TaxID=419590 RepID=A0ABP4QNF9_9ACTN